MATALYTMHRLTRFLALQRASAVRRVARPAPFTAAVPKSIKQQQKALVARAAAEVRVYKALANQWEPRSTPRLQWQPVAHTTAAHQHGTSPHAMWRTEVIETD